MEAVVGSSPLPRTGIILLRTRYPAGLRSGIGPLSTGMKTAAYSHSPAFGNEGRSECEVDVYAFMTTMSNALTIGINLERMSILLSEEVDFETWLSHSAAYDPERNSPKQHHS